MRLKPTCCSIFIWLFFSLITPGIIAAETFLVLMDNSQTMRRPTRSPLSRTYLRDIRGILSRSGPHTFYFGPIGDPERPRQIEKPWLISSDMPREKIKDAIGKVFDFNDLYTKIDLSLKEVEGTEVFKDAEYIILISDMEPDFQVKAAPWKFDAKDFRDLKKYLRRIENWVDDEDKKVTIILHGWDQTPSIGDRNKLSSFKLDLNYAIKLTSNGFSIPGKDLVRTGIYILRKRWEDKIRLLNIPVWVGKNEVNKEGFINKLCGCLPVDDPYEELCQKPIRTDFNIQVNISRKVRVSDHHIKRLQSDLATEIYAGPKRKIILKRISRKLSKKRGPDIDYNFDVIRGEGDPFRDPRVMVSYKDLDGEVKRIKGIRPDKKLSSYDNMITWLKNIIENNLQEYVSKDFPITRKPKKIFLRDYKNKMIPRGYRIYAKWIEAPKDRKFKKSRVERVEEHDGMVLLKLPRLNPEFPLFLESRSPDGKSMDREISLIKHDLVKKREDIHLKINKRHFMQTSLNFSGLGNTPARIRVYLKDGTSLYEVYSGEKKPENNSMEISLLPGNYVIAAEPIGNGKILHSFRNYIIRPEELDNQKENKNEFVFHFSQNPLSVFKDSSWEREVFGDEMTADLTANQKNLAVTSPNFLEALLRLTSDHLGTRKDDLKVFWKNLYDFYFHKSQQATYARVMQRTLRNIGLVDEDGKLEPLAFTMFQVMFDMFIDGDSFFITGQRNEVVERRRMYEDWIDSITDDQPYDGFISKTMADLLKYNE